MSKCGTYAGWNVHAKAGETPCDPCRLARNQYARDRRAKGNPAVTHERLVDKARQAALWRLKDYHRAEFDILVADELRVLLRLAAKGAS
jgi:hypothetical protein